MDNELAEWMLLVWPRAANRVSMMSGRWCEEQDFVPLGRASTKCNEAGFRTAIIINFDEVIILRSFSSVLPSPESQVDS
jgi:hypothetical protein